MNERCFNCPNVNQLCVGKSINCNISKEELRQQILETLKNIYVNEHDLILRAINEVCISAYFWHYFCNNYANIYKDMNIDIEYNKNGREPKRYYAMTDVESHNAIPDMIIHKRLCNKSNFAIFEFKKNKNNISVDYRKLKAFTRQDFSEEYLGFNSKYNYQYRYGISVLIKKDLLRLVWFEKGEIVQEESFIPDEIFSFSH